jgi:hypothetical protein
MRRTVNITLLENASGGRSPRKLKDQLVEIGHETVTRGVTVDGFPFHGNHPRKLVWYRGTADQLRGVTDVLMEDSRTTEVILDASVNTFNFAPTDVYGGVEFWVLRRDPKEGRLALS